MATVSCEIEKTRQIQRKRFDERYTSVADVRRAVKAEFANISSNVVIEPGCPGERFCFYLSEPHGPIVSHLGTTIICEIPRGKPWAEIDEEAKRMPASSDRIRIFFDKEKITLRISE